MCSVLTKRSRMVCVQRPLIPVEFGVFVHGFAAPPAGCAVGVVVDESGAGFVVCPAAALLGFGEFAVLHVGLGSLGVCWWMCEDLNLMDQRVLAFVKVGLWLADCSPVESHPCCIVLLMLQCSSRCVVVLLRCCARVALSCWLSLAAMQCSSRCVVKSLSSACPCRRARCARRRCSSPASRLLLLRCCAHVALLCSLSLQ